MVNYKLTVQYDGRNYAGWQIQKDVVTVQQKITDVLEMLLKHKVKLIGSGRTDAGVHALGQTANFITNDELDIFKFQHSLNSILPADIAVTQMEKKGQEFHSRFDARKRSYIYLVNKIKSPFYKDYSYYFPNIGKIDIGELNRISKTLMGEHDFTSLSKRNTDTENKVCNIYDIHWRSSGSLVIFYIEADRFLRGMVRAVAGSIIQLASKGLAEKELAEIMDKKEFDSKNQLVPAHGLFLYKVKY